MNFFWFEMLSTTGQIAAFSEWFSAPSRSLETPWRSATDRRAKLKTALVADSPLQRRTESLIHRLRFSHVQNTTFQRPNFCLPNKCRWSVCLIYFPSMINRVEIRWRVYQNIANISSNSEQFDLMAWFEHLETSIFLSKEGACLRRFLRKEVFCEKPSKLESIKLKVLIRNAVWNF